jgi:hypothetical protein
MKTFNIDEILSYEKFPKLCEQLNGALSFRDAKSELKSFDTLVQYLRNEGYDLNGVMKGGMGCGYRYFLTFNNDSQYLEFVLRYS